MPDKVMQLFTERTGIEDDMSILISFSPAPQEIDRTKVYGLRSKGYVEYYNYMRQNIPMELEFTFETALNPPLRAIDKIARRFNELMFRLLFEKPEDSTPGCIIWSGGKRVLYTCGIEEEQD